MQKNKYDKIRNNAKWDKEIIFFEDLNSQNILKSLPGGRGQRSQFLARPSSYGVRPAW